MIFPRRNKYGAKKTKLAGEDKSFPSRCEAAMFAHLRQEEKLGEITNLMRYATVRLSDAQIVYKPDARFDRAGVASWSDAKGFETERWRVVKKLWASYGPGPLEIYKSNRRGIYLAEIIVPKGHPHRQACRNRGDRQMKTEYSPEDFRKPVGGVQFVGQVECFQEISDMANAFLPEIKKAWLAELVKDALRVYACAPGISEPRLWHSTPRQNHKYSEFMADDTHTAFLVQITPIEEGGK